MSADRTPGDFGATLRDARTRRGVSLRQIANATKISVSVLEALERNDISRLPGGIFGRAFVRSYAIEVGLDPETAIQDFIAQFPHDSVTVGHPTSEQNEDNEVLESDRRMAGTFLSLLVVSMPIAGAVLYFSTAGRHVSVASAPMAVEAASAPTTAPAARPAAPIPEASVPAAAPPPAASAPAPVASAPATVALTTAAPGIAAPAPPALPAPAVPPVPPDGDRLLIALSVKRPCWVSATVDGQKAIERLLQAGEEQTVEVRREMVLTAGDASAITMTLNGADAKPLGRAGEVVTARLNLTNFKDFLQTR
jgi:cytoskeleton protein RodZ